MGLLWAMDLVVSYAGFSIGVMLPVMKEEMGFSPIQAGLLGASYFFGFAVMVLPSSVWLSRFSPRRITLLSGGACGLLLFLQGWSPVYWVLLVARLAFVLLAVGRLQAEVLLIQQWFDHRTYARVNGITFGVIAFAQATAVGATPFFMEALGGWRNVYYVAGALMLLVALAWLRLGRERPVARARAAPEVVPRENPLAVLARRPVLWLVASAQVGAAVAFGSFITFWPTFALEEREMTLARAGPLLSFFSIGGVIGAFSAGPLSDLMRRRKPLIWIAGLVLPVLYLLLLLTPWPQVVPLLFLGAGYFVFAVVPLLFTIPYEMGLRPREIAVSVGLIRTVTSTGASLGPLMMGVLQQVYGSLFLALAVTVPLPLTLTVAGLLMPETRRRQGDAEASAE